MRHISSHRVALIWGALALACGGPALPEAGEWQGQGQLALLRSGEAVLYIYDVAFEAGGEAQACTCEGQAIAEGAGRWADRRNGLELRLEGSQLMVRGLAGAAEPCCPAGWGGDQLRHAEGPLRCEVAAEGVWWRPTDGPSPAPIHRGQAVLALLGDGVAEAMVQSGEGGAERVGHLPASALSCP